MRVLCFIDSFGSGGAQRQIVNLACGLYAKGHKVEFLIYRTKFDFFRSKVDAIGIPIHEVKKREGFSWNVLLWLIKCMRSGEFELIISFLDRPNFYCEIARLFTFYRGCLIVSERSSYLSERWYSLSRFLRLLHIFATNVVANSNSQGSWLRKNPFIASRVKVIRNGYQLTSKLAISQQFNVSTLKLLVMSRIDSGLKNGLNLAKSLILYREKYLDCPILMWAGRQQTDLASLKERREIDTLLEANPEVSVNWKWLGEQSDIQVLLENCDALIHVSFFEGLPNSVCEALIAGRPVIASNVCDNPELVADGVRGFLCEPDSPESICAAIRRFVELDPQKRKELGNNARIYAEANLSIDRMIDEYESLFVRNIHPLRANK